MELLKKLEEIYPDSSKTTLRKWIAQKRVLPDGSLLPKKKYAERGIEILYEDKEIVVIEKPAGLLSVATALDKRSVHDILKQRYYRAQVFPVHRLDKETSGILVFAYTTQARDVLKKRFELHEIEREYEAIVMGEITPRDGTWKSLLFEGKNFYMMSGKHGKLAITHYQTVTSRLWHVPKTQESIVPPRKEKSRFSQHKSALQPPPPQRVTLIRVRLETGRKNQIRVQSSDAGHPVLGDQKYGYRGPKLKRLYLHARKLGIKHPITDKKMEFLSSASLANEFKTIGSPSGR